MKAHRRSWFLAFLVGLACIAGCTSGGAGPGTTPADGYSVTYDGNGNTGGSVPVDATHYTQGQTATVLGNTGGLVKTGYVFASWNTQADGTGTSYLQGQVYTIATSNVTLYARWTPNGSGGYTVTYDGNGATGNVPVDSGSYVQTQKVTLPAGAGGLTYDGYTFVGWQTKADGSGVAYAPGTTFEMPANNVTLYALWAGGYAYVVNQNSGSAGNISQYTIGPNGALTAMFTPTVATGGANSQLIAADPSGKYIYVSNVSANTVSQFTIGANGALTAMATPTVLMGTGAGVLYYPFSIAVHPTGKWAYVANIEKLTVNQYAIGADGALSPLTPLAVTTPASPDSIAIHPTGKWAYVADADGNTVSQYAIVQTAGTLALMTPPTVASGHNAYTVVVEPKGKAAYVTNYGDGFLSQYAIDQSTGALTPMVPPTVPIAAGAVGAVSIAVDPTGRFAYASILVNEAAPDAVIAQFTIDQTTGALTAMATPTLSAGGAAAVRIAIESSGKFAYATCGNSGWGSTTVAQFSIDQTTGALTLLKNPTVQAGSWPNGIVTVGK